MTRPIQHPEPAADPVTEREQALARAVGHLEWKRLEQAVLDRCRGRGTQRAGLPIETDLSAVRMAQTETGEALQLLQDGEPLPLDDVRDVREHLARVEREGALDAPALADLRVALQGARSLRRFIAARRQTLPALFAVCHLDPSLDTLEDELGASVALDGTLHDHASPELRRLRAECSNLRQRIIGRLQELIEKHADLLSDRIYTQREGRYVVPVRTDAHDRLPGIVHATSESGASVFVEPRAVVTQGNRLKMAQGELAREEARILAALSALVAERLAPLQAAVSAVQRYDIRSASALLARDLGAHPVTLSSDGVIDLKQAKHPLLLLDGVEVVPNDVSISPGHGVVISGPNAGGKTVLLKTLGLFALMVRAGLALPATEGSTMGFFDGILSDLGDEQSTRNNLSTFSAHVTSLARILRLSGPRSLVLLDELCGGTDPEEGAALACAIVEHLTRREATVLVTTHYEPLKAFSLRQACLRSASVGFDLETMLPNFALAWDVPGASSALSVAARFGIEADVIATAERVLPEHAKSFDDLVKQLQHQATALHAERAEAAETQRAAEALQREHERRLETLKERSQRKLTAEAEQLMHELREARVTLRDTKAALRKAAKAGSADAMREAEAKLQAVAERVSVGGDLGAGVAGAAPEASTEHAGGDGHPKTFAIGDEVYITHLRSRGTIIEADDKAGRYRVAAGALKLWAEATSLRSQAPDSHAKPDRDGKRNATRSTGRRGPRGSDTEADAPVTERRTSDNTVSLKGMRVDDALPLMESFIDRMLLGNDRVGYVLHGHGTGALRKAVREHLEGVVSHVTHTRPGNDDEGGEAFTVFYLR